MNDDKVTQHIEEQSEEERKRITQYPPFSFPRSLFRLLFGCTRAASPVALGRYKRGLRRNSCARTHFARAKHR